MYSFVKSKNILLNDDLLVAEVRQQDPEQLELLVSKANLADRDEGLLDDLGEMIVNRNLS